MTAPVAAQHVRVLVEGILVHNPDACPVCAGSYRPGIVTR